MWLESFLEDAAQSAPDKIALVCGDARLTFAEVDRAANRVSRALLALGIRRGDRVVHCLDNSVAAAVSLFAIWKAGAVAVLVHAGTKPEKLARIIDDAGARGLIANAKLVAALAVPPPITIVADDATDGFDALAARGDDRAPPKTHIDQDIAALIYTSGSTGTPKGVMHSHASLASATQTIAYYLENQAGDVVLQVLPLSFGYGLMQWLSMVHAGGTLVLERSFAFPQVALQKIERERVTGIAMVPTVAALFLQSGLRQDGARDLSSLRYITNAGAGMPVPLVRRVRAALPHVKLYLMYGQTECIRAAFLPPDEVDERPGTVGRGMPNQEAWLVDDDGRIVDNGVGELVVRGAHVMRGYWGLPAETERKLHEGKWPGERVLHTGDLFRKDADGYLTFVARKDDIIKTRGEKVSPKEVEDALCTIDGVAEAAAAGVPDDLLGEAVRAFVAPLPGSALDERALLRACRERLEEFAVPKHIAILSALPRTINGKIDKRSLLAGAFGG